MSNVLVSGSIAYDRIMDFPGLFSAHIVPEKLHNLSVSFQIDTFSENFGGCAGNVAYNLALLGQEPLILSTAGRDFGRYRDYLAEQGIDASSVHEVDTDITATAYIMTDKSDNQISAFYPGAGRTPYGGDVPTKGAALGIIVAGCGEDMRAMPEIYRGAGIKYLYDPGQQLTELSGAHLLDAISTAEVLFANDYELGLIVFKTGLDEQKLLERVPTIVATLGEQGARLLTRDGETHIDAVRAQAVVDPTGAGDSHRAGFAAGMLAGLPLEQCAKVASAVASYVVEKYGTQSHRFTKEEIAARYKDTYKEEWPL